MGAAPAAVTLQPWRNPPATRPVLRRRVGVGAARDRAERVACCARTGPGRARLAAAVPSPALEPGVPVARAPRRRRPRTWTLPAGRQAWRSWTTAWPSLIALAGEHDARLIVVGSHGISPVTSALLGSVAAGVVHHAKRPVLVVPAERAA